MTSFHETEGNLSPHKWGNFLPAGRASSCKDAEQKISQSWSASCKKILHCHSKRNPG